MAPRTIYANLADGLQPFTLWDASLSDMGSLGIIPCTALGTNAIVLTPIAAVFSPNVAIPQSLQAFSFVATASSSGAVTIQVGTTAALKLYRMDGVTQATTGDIVNTVLYLISYNAALNGAVGGFQILSPISSFTGGSINGATITNSTYNGNTWTTGTGTLTIAAGKTETFSNTLTFAGPDGGVLTFQGTDTYVGRATTDTLTNKTLGAATLSGTLSGGGNQINNVVIGTSTPLAGSFTTITGTAMTIAPVAGDAILTLNAPAVATNQAAIILQDNSVAKWQIGKNASNAWYIFDNAVSTFAMTITSNVGFNISYATASTTPATGALTINGGLGVGGALFANSSVLSINPTAGMGYATGAGGAVTQITSRTTGVTLNKISGAITLFAAAPAVGTWVSFTVTNSAVAATDTISLSVKSSNGANTYIAHVTLVAASSFQISFTTIVGTTSDSPVINFNVIKGVAS